MCITTPLQVNNSWEAGGRADVIRRLLELSGCCLGVVPNSTPIADLTATAFPTGIPEKCDMIYARLDNGTTYANGNNGDNDSWGLLTDPIYQTYNLTATAPPTVNDDADDGYVFRSRWYDMVSNDEYLLFDPTPGAAVWIRTTVPLLATTEVVSGSYVGNGTAGRIVTVSSSGAVPKFVWVATNAGTNPQVRFEGIPFLTSGTGTPVANQRISAVGVNNFTVGGGNIINQGGVTYVYFCIL